MRELCSCDIASGGHGCEQREQRGINERSGAASLAASIVATAAGSSTTDVVAAARYQQYRGLLDYLYSTPPLLY